MTYFIIQAKKKNKTSPEPTLQNYTNNAFEDDNIGQYKSNGFLNKRPGNPENDLHRALDSMAHEISDAKPKKGNEKKGQKETKVIRLIPEDIKGKKFKDLSVTELEELGEINASQDRFRYRYTEDDYRDDVSRSNTANVDIKWIN